MTRQRMIFSDLQQVSSGGATLLAGLRAAPVGVLCGCLMAGLPAGTGALASPAGAAKQLSARVGETGTARLLRIGGDAFTVEDSAGPSGAPLPLKIQLPPSPAGSYSFLMFRNMPPNFTLSEGFGTKDYWAASLHDLGRLELIPPEGYEGAFTMEVLLVKGPGTDPERRTANVVFKSEPSAPATAAADDQPNLPAASLAPAPEPTAALPPAAPPPPEPAVQAADTPPPLRDMTDIEQSMMERGDTYWKQGDVASARLLYRALAKKGLAPAALAMAHTYDPEHLSTLAIRGLLPDITQAKNWYRMAEELGSTQAAQRLAALNAQGE
jgi:hypothetical protein